MRLTLALTALLALGACDSPHPLSDFAGAPPTEVTVNGDRFSVRVVGSEAMATRLNVRFGAGANRVNPSAGLAIEQVSGCRIETGSLVGDAAVAQARLIC